MRSVTLCFLIKEGEILLAMKKRGFGVGKWNGIGGKVQDRETIKEAAVRELKEEVDINTCHDPLEKVGDIKFYFNEKPEWNQHMHVFFIKDWQGEPQETEEMAPQWYDKSNIPYEGMWIDDIYWLPKALAGKKIEAGFHFVKDGDELDKFEVRELT